MATEAKVRSVDALGSFRASLIVFVTRARRAIDQVGEEVSRTRQWVLNDQRMHWTEQLRKRTRAKEQAEQELFSAKLSTLKDTVTRQEMALRKAKALCEEAETKMRNVKIWNRDFDRFADPLVKKLDIVRHFLEHKLPQGVNHLETTQRILESYSQSAPPVAAPPVPAEPENQA
jgi:sugar-specific transcriptional regulator TrmB